MPQILKARVGSTRRWIVTSTVVILLVALLGSFSLLFYTARSIDALQQHDERALVQRTLDRTQVRMVGEVASATVWDEAWVALGARPDMAWADLNLAEYFHRYFDHDLTYVVRHGTVTYASRDGVRVANDALGAIPRDFAPIEAAVLASVGPKRRSGKVNLEGQSTARGVLASGGVLYLVAAADPTAETRPVSERFADPEAVVISARRIGPVFLRGIEADLGVHDLTIAQGDGRGATAEALVTDPGGKVLGVIATRASRPGMGILGRAAPEILAGLAILIAAATVLMIRVSGALARMERNERDLTKARDEAQAANQAKSQFLANISHEIRTPLNGVLGMAQVMAIDELSDRQRERMAIIMDSGQALLALLNDLLDLARMEAGKFELARSPIDIALLVKSTGAAFEGMAAQKGLSIRVEVAPEVEGAWIADGARLRQVLSNLVSNAVKFSDAGSVSVHVEASPSGLCFSVRDTGIGIAPHDLRRLFDKFQQVDASSTRRFAGTGLGLAITRELVELMGGVVRVESRLGEGSMFQFELPLQRTDATLLPPPHSRLGGRRQG